MYTDMACGMYMGWLYDLSERQVDLEAAPDALKAHAAAVEDREGAVGELERFAE